jgi:hypothetical protein
MMCIPTDLLRTNMPRAFGPCVILRFNPEILAAADKLQKSEEVGTAKCSGCIQVQIRDIREDALLVNK